MLKAFWKPDTITRLGRWSIKLNEVPRKIDFANVDNCCCGFPMESKNNKKEKKELLKPKRLHRTLASENA